MRVAGISYGVGDFLNKALGLHVEEALKFEITGPYQRKRLRAALAYRLRQYNRGFRSFYFRHPQTHAQWIYVIRLY